MTKREIDTLILDLDNTLFDWFEIWYASFKPIYDGILQLSDLPDTEIDLSIRKIHQRVRTSEYTFLLDEIDLGKAVPTGSSARDLLSAEVAESRRARDRAMKLYPSVFRTLWDIKNRGTKIVAYTESMSFYSAYRLKRFGLDGLIEVMFCPADHSNPSSDLAKKLRSHPDDFYELQVTEIRSTPSGELKPNPHILSEIIREVAADTHSCAYVGDSLFKDIAMAREVGVYALHAKYGEAQRKPEYELLQRVSHWTDDDVKRERAITQSGLKLGASGTLSECFSEIYRHCDFQPFHSKVSKAQNAGKAALALDTWKKCVDVQQHFNDIELRVRNMAVTVVVALLAGAGFAMQNSLVVPALGYNIPLTAIIIFLAIAALFSFWLMDRYWYHILLKGAVSHASKIEREYADVIPGIGLGLTISNESQNVKILGFKVNSNNRLSWFYRGPFIALIVLLAITLFSGTEPITAVSLEAVAQEPAN